MMVPWHVSQGFIVQAHYTMYMLRGNGGQEIFFGQKDRFRFYRLVQEGMERYGHKVHAFCLMTTHAHLAIQGGDIGLPRIIENLAFDTPVG